MRQIIITVVCVLFVVYGVAAVDAQQQKMPAGVGGIQAVPKTPDDQGKLAGGNRAADRADAS